MPPTNNLYKRLYPVHYTLDLLAYPRMRICRLSCLKRCRSSMFGDVSVHHKNLLVYFGALELYSTAELPHIQVKRKEVANIKGTTTWGKQKNHHFGMRCSNLSGLKKKKSCLQLSKNLSQTVLIFLAIVKYLTFTALREPLTVYNI